MAWLHCVPSGELGKMGVSRIELVGLEEAEAIMPPIGELSYLFKALLTIGICESSSGSFSATRWSDIMHWPRISQFLPCEIETIHSLSKIYANMRNSGSNAPQPWEPSEE